MAVLAAALMGTGSVHAAEGATRRAAPATVRADCIEAAARHHQVNALVLKALAWHESRFDASAVGRNTDGSIDLGAFQINSIHLTELRRHGLDERHLLDPCLSAFVAAWHYARQVREWGNTWAAVGAYHSRTPARQRWYANQIAGVLMGWGVLPAGPLPYAAGTTLAPGRAGRPAERSASPR